MKKEVFEATSLLIGTVVGAGVLGMPYVISKSGALIGLILILVILCTVLIVNLQTGEIVLRTKERHQLSGYAGKYLGKTFKHITAGAMFIYIFGALVAYVLGEGQAFYNIFGGSKLLYSLIFFIIMTLIMYSDLGGVAKSELIMVLPMVLILILITIIAIFNIDTSNLVYNNPKNFFVPFGVILFAFLGAVSIPEVAPELKTQKKYLKRVILYSTLFVGVLYLSFAFATLGVTGKETTELATTGLGKAIGYNLNLISNLFAIFAMSTGFLALGLAVKWILVYDYGLNKKLALFLTCVPPFLVALSGLTTFTKVIGVAGAIGGGLESVIILLMYHKARKMGNRKPEYVLPYHEYLNYTLIAILVCGVVYSVYSIIRV